MFSYYQSHKGVILVWTEILEDNTQLSRNTCMWKLPLHENFNFHNAAMEIKDFIQNMICWTWRQNFAWGWGQKLCDRVLESDLSRVGVYKSFLCRLWSIAAHRDHFVRGLSVCVSVRLSVCLSSSHTFLVVTHSYVSKGTHAFFGMLPFWYEDSCSQSCQEFQIFTHISIKFTVNL